MAMVHTPKNANPKKRNSRSSFGNQDSSPKNSPAVKNNTMTVGALLAETTTTAQHGIHLLKQTRNMRSDLRSGLADDLELIIKRINNIEGLYNEGKDRETGPSIRKESRDSQTQCELNGDGSTLERCNCEEAVTDIVRYIRDLIKKEMTEVKEYVNEELNGLREYISINTVNLMDQVDKNKDEVLETVNNKVESVSEIVKETNEEVGKTVREWEVKVHEHQEPATYATVVSTGRKTQTTPQFRTLHSLIVTDKEDSKTGIEIVEEVGKIIDAKKEGTQVERIRKGKDRKVIIGFKSKKDRDRIKKKLEQSKAKLDVKCIENKDPQVVLYGVLKGNKDEEIISAIKTQNKQLMEHILGGEEDRINVKYRKQGKDEKTEHIVLTVSPGLWTCFTKAGHLYIDVQRVRVADQSPLIQCSRCLGYGHGRRFCSAAAEKCGHCSGAHHQSQCEDRKNGKKACCINCTKDEQAETDHNAFSAECPVRKRWDAMARAMVAYGPIDE